jgi:hypothetical protein
MLVPLLACSNPATAATPRKYTAAQVAHFKANIKATYPKASKSGITDFVLIAEGACVGFDHGKSISSFDGYLYNQLHREMTSSQLLSFVSNMVVDAITDLCPSHTNLLEELGK